MGLQKPKRNYRWDTVPVDPKRETIKPIYDGLAVGVIRSSFAGIKLSDGSWCATFGHRYRVWGGEEVCTNCLRERTEIESGV